MFENDAIAKIARNLILFIFVDLFVFVNAIWGSPFLFLVQMNGEKKHKSIKNGN